MPRGTSQRRRRTTTRSPRLPVPAGGPTLRSVLRAGTPVNGDQAAAVASSLLGTQSPPIVPPSARRVSAGVEVSEAGGGGRYVDGPVVGVEEEDAGVVRPTLGPWVLPDAPESSAEAMVDEPVEECVAEAGGDEAPVSHVHLSLSSKRAATPPPPPTPHSTSTPATPPPTFSTPPAAARAPVSPHDTPPRTPQTPATDTPRTAAMGTPPSPLTPLAVGESLPVPDRGGTAATPYVAHRVGGGVTLREDDVSTTEVSWVANVQSPGHKRRMTRPWSRNSLFDISVQLRKDMDVKSEAADSLPPGHMLTPSGKHVHLGNPAQAVATVRGTPQIKSIIRLEDMSAASLRALMWSMYVVVVAALLFANYENGLRRRQVCLSVDVGCDPELVPSMDTPDTYGACGLVTGANTSFSWSSGLVEFRPVHLPFTVEVQFRREAQPEAVSVLATLATASFGMHTVPFGGGEFATRLTQSEVQRPETVVSCGARASTCDEVSVLDPRSFGSSGALFGAADKHRSNRLFINTTVVFGSVGDATGSSQGVVPHRLCVEHTNHVLQYAHVNVRMVLVVLTVVALVVWLWFWPRLITSGVSVSEQFWVMVALFALLLFLDPLYIPATVARRHPGMLYASAVVYRAGTCILFVLFLLLVTGVRDPSLRHSWSFYVPKLALGLVLTVFSVLSTLLQLYLELNDEQLWTSAAKLGIDVVTIVSWAALGLAAVWSTFHAVKELKSLPYLSSRFRQLSFRFWGWMSVTLTLYFIVVLFVDTYDAALLDTRTRSTSNTFVLAVYILFLARVYFPASFSTALEEPSARHKAFKVKVARWLCEFSWLAYMEPPGTPIEKATWGVLDLSSLDFDLAKFCTNTEHDIHGFVATNADTIVISFRGTMSKQNVQTDLRFGRVLVPPEMGLDINPVLRAKVHGGFNSAYNSVRDQVMGALRQVILRWARRADELAGLGAEHKAGTGEGDEEDDDAAIERFLSHLTPSVYVTGHSLGGACALLCALDILHTWSNKLSVQVYTFGAPRVGNLVFARQADRVLPNHWRIVHDKDLVSSVPPYMCGLFKHAGVEVIVDHIGNMVYNPSFVETWLVPARTSLRDHTLGGYVLSLDAVQKRLRHWWGEDDATASVDDASVRATTFTVEDVESGGGHAHDFAAVWRSGKSTRLGLVADMGRLQLVGERSPPPVFRARAMPPSPLALVPEESKEAVLAQAV